MPLPKRLARFNRLVTNKVAIPFAREIPWFGVLRHVGRNSATVYQTPLVALETDGSIIVALFYGPDVDWLKNAVVAGRSEMTIRGKNLPVGRPRRLETGEGMEAMPRAVRQAIRRLGITEFVAFPVVTEHTIADGGIQP